MEHIPVRHIDASHKEPTLLYGFRIRDVSSMLGGKQLKQELHRHDFYFILVLEKGKGNHEIDFSSYKLAAHQVFLMRPGQVHQIVMKAGCTGYLLEFKQDFYPYDSISAELLQKVIGADLYQLSEPRFGKIMNILRFIIDEFTNKEERYLQAIQNDLSAFFIELLRERKSKNDKISVTNRYNQERLEEFLNLLHNNITRTKKASTYAEMLNLSPYQLNSITRSMVDKTSSQLIEEHVILESKRLLLATTNQVSQIAYSLGYEDVSYFIRFFKKRTGNSPEAFRNNFR